MTTHYETAWNRLLKIARELIECASEEDGYRTEMDLRVQGVEAFVEGARQNAPPNPWREGYLRLRAASLRLLDASGGHSRALDDFAEALRTSEAVIEALGGDDSVSEVGG